MTPKKKYILSSPKLQYFSIPEKILYYVSKNPASIKVYLKLVKTCKYFYFKNRLIVLPVLNYQDSSKWITDCIIESQKSDLSKHIPKIWLFCELRIYQSTFIEKSASLLAQKIYRCDISILLLISQTLTYREFQIFTSSKKLNSLYLDSTMIYNSQKSVISFGDLFENLPNLRYCTLKHIQLSYLVDSVLNAIKNLQNLKGFVMNEIPEDFDFLTFSKFMDENTTVKFTLKFVDNLSDSYQKQLKEYASRRVASWNQIAPFIFFNGFAL